MKVILIQGRVNAGKTTLCNVIKPFLEKKATENNVIPSSFKGDDFCHRFIIDGKTVIIVSASDENDIIDELEKIFNENQHCDIFITVIRPKNHNPKLHNRVQNIFNNKDVTTIDLDTLTKDFIEDKIFNNEFIKTFNNLI